MRTIAVATTSRSDWSSGRPIVRALSRRAGIEPRILVAGAHLLDEWGGTVAEIEAEGLAPVERVSAFAGTTPVDAANTVAAAASGFGESFAASRPDVLLVIGDRIELLGVAAAALAFRLPVAHVSGGDTTGGAMDDLVRHAVSKLAQLHFVAMPEHASRLAAMGEDERRITVTGDPALDDVHGPWPSREQLAASLGVELTAPLGLVGFHAATLGGASPAAEATELLAGLSEYPGTLVFTAPGADPGADEIARLIGEFVAARDDTVLVPSLGQDRYYGLLASADVLIGNSSSGIWEAPSFELPVVDVGDRQAGRLRAANVIHADAQRDAVAGAVRQALDPEFRAGLRGLVNPYGDGRAAERIADVLERVELDDAFVAKWRA